MNVLMLMDFPVNVGVSVRVNVSVDFGVYFSGDCWSTLGEEELLLCQVVLIVHGAHAVFLWAGGGDGGGSHAAPVPLSIRGPVGALQYFSGGGGGSWSAGRRTVFSALAEPQQHGAKDEDYSSRDADNDGPGEGTVGR